MNLKKLNVSKCIQIYPHIPKCLLIQSLIIVISVFCFVQVYLNVSEDCHIYLDIFKCISTYSKLPNVSQYISLPKTSLELFLLRCFHCQSVPSHLMISTRKIVLGTKKKKSFVHNCPTSKDFLSSFSLSTLPLTTTKTRRRKNDTTK